MSQIKERVQFRETLEFEVMECCACGVPFGMHKEMLRCRRSDRETFYCPNGHAQSFRKSQAQIVQEQLESEQKLRARLETRLQQAFAANSEKLEENRHLSRMVAARKGQITKLKNRVANGVCPCCNRHFVNVERHMKSQHPSFDKED